jgi:N-acylneuraminate cytidylyltransferase
MNLNLSMEYSKEVLAIIPARGGSKGIKNKNITNLNGSSLISYSIKAALESKLISRVICSTDSEIIAEEAIKHGAEVPFLRPDQISQDNSSDIEYFNHAIEWLKINESYKPKLLVQLRPTSPLRNLEMIDEAIQIMIEDGSYDSLRAVSKPDHTPYKMWKLVKRNEMKPLLKLTGNKEPYNTNRQNLPEVYAQTGSIDITRPETLEKYKSMTGKKIYPFIMDERYFIDIDNIESLELAEIRMKRLNCIKFN